MAKIHLSKQGHRACAGRAIRHKHQFEQNFEIVTPEKFNELIKDPRFSNAICKKCLTISNENKVIKNPARKRSLPFRKVKRVKNPGDEPGTKYKKIFGKWYYYYPLKGGKKWHEVKSIAIIRTLNEKTGAVSEIQSAEKQYLRFHHKTEVKRVNDSFDLPKEFVYIGKAVELIYESDKFDGKPRLYKHKFKKHGNILAKPEGAAGFSDLIVMNNLKFKIKPEGITG